MRGGGRLAGPGGDLLSRVLRRSTIGAEGFHGRVRDGIGWVTPRHDHRALEANPRCSCCAVLFVCVCVWVSSFVAPAAAAALAVVPGQARERAELDQADRAISTGQLHALLRFHTRPIDVVVFHGSRRDLVLRRASRLDAFSGYPVRT